MGAIDAAGAGWICPGAAASPAHSSAPGDSPAYPLPSPERPPWTSGPMLIRRMPPSNDLEM